MRWVNRLIIAVFLPLGLSASVFGQGLDAEEVAAELKEALQERLKVKAEEVCTKIRHLPKPVCLALASGEDVKDKLTDPATLNSALAEVWGSNPFNLQFKVFQIEDGEDTLGFSYNKKVNIRRFSLGESESWNRRFELDFNAKGNVAFDQAANPRDFLDTKLSLAHSWSTNISGVPKEIGLATQEAFAALAACPDLTAPSCVALDNVADEMLSRHLSGFTYMKVGFNAGYESDQAFEVTQTTFGAHAYGQIESWTDDDFLGKLGLFPAIGVGLDRVDPDEESPRSLTGDSSRFYRFSGEASVKMPLNLVEGAPLFFTANYRYYKELGASDLVKNAGLDDHNLLTLSISGPAGIFVSYSTGELPLDADRSNVVEVGWKTHF